LSEIRLSSEKKLRLFSGRGFPELSEAVAEELGIPLTPTSAYDFANGEIFVRFEESVRGCDALIMKKLLPLERPLQIEWALFSKG
jgi:ribose-phosphate pyrophosphokinase